MTDAQLVYRWQLCETKAEKIGMTLKTNADNCFSASGNGKNGSHASFYSCDSVNALLGYLEGIKDAREKNAKK